MSRRKDCEGSSACHNRQQTQIGSQRDWGEKEQHQAARQPDNALKQWVSNEEWPAPRGVAHQVGTVTHAAHDPMGNAVAKKHSGKKLAMD
jgi:hypothetical protein